MAREVKKTDPTGVRFDKDLLEGVVLAGIAKSPQHALNLYEKSYIELVELKTKIIQSAEIIEVIEETKNAPVEDKIEIPEADYKPTMRERIALEKANLNTKK